MPYSLNSTKTAINLSNLFLLTKSYDSPFWVYDAAIIKKQIASLKFFDVIRFAQKACSNIHILRLMRKLGIKVDAISYGELERALTAGFQPDNEDIVFTSDVFDKQTLLRIVELNVTVNIGSIDMLHQLGAISPGHKIWLRINPGFGYSYHHKTTTGGEHSKHGIWYLDLKKALIVIKKYNLYLVGLHMHIGSDMNYIHLNKVCTSMVDNAISFDQDIEKISAGGGLSVPYHVGQESIDTAYYFKLWDAARHRITKHFGHPIKLEIEPGRFLVAESGLLVSQVRAVKKIGDYRFLLIDAGFNDLMRPSMYGSYHHISVMTSDNRILNIDETFDSIVAGPLCESGDVFTQQKNGKFKKRLLPKVKVGDYLIFHDTGAYGASMSSNYNSRPLIPEILFENGNIREIRRAQTIQELLKLEE